MNLIDTHIHLDFPDYDKDRSSLISECYTKGITQILTIGSSDGFESAKNAINIATEYTQIYASVGIHPHSASTKFDPQVIEDLAKNPKVVAIGETGLDFFKELSPKDKQYLWFKAQIEIALKLNKPLIIHSRNAGEESLKLLIETGASKVGGVFHCFSENAEFAQKLKEINFLVSFTGSITFKKNSLTRNYVRDIPLSQIMLETDGPYMAPEPYRGKRSDSSHILEIAKVIAKEKNIPLEEVATQTTLNAKNLFRI